MVSLFGLLPNNWVKGWSVSSASFWSSPLPSAYMVFSRMFFVPLSSPLHSTVYLSY